MIGILAPFIGAGETTMEIRRLVNRCKDTACSSVFETDRGTIVILGRSVDIAVVGGAPGESAVEISREIFLAGARELAAP